MIEYVRGVSSHSPLSNADIKYALSDPKNHPEFHHSFYANNGYFAFVDNNKEKRDSKLAKLNRMSNDEYTSISDDEYIEMSNLFTESYNRASKSVSLTLAASFSDHCLAKIADALKETGSRQSNSVFNDESFLFQNRSRNYRTLFNKESLHFEPKDENSEFVKLKRSVRELSSIASKTNTKIPHSNAFTVDDSHVLDDRVYITNAYDFPYDYTDLISLFGSVASSSSSKTKSISNEELGKELLLSHIEDLLTYPPHHPQYDHLNFIPTEYTKGTIGRYATVVDPPLSFLYVYNNIDNAFSSIKKFHSVSNSESSHLLGDSNTWKTQKLVRTQLWKRFRNDLEGIPDNYDGGNMFSSLIFSALGFYPGSSFIYFYICFEKGFIFYEERSII
jgi:hypothetical protein